MRDAGPRATGSLDHGTTPGERCRVCALFRVLALPAAVGLVTMLAGAANTPTAVVVMAMELLRGPVGVYAARWRKPRRS
jgi:hypothetical protein